MTPEILPIFKPLPSDCNLLEEHSVSIFRPFYVQALRMIHDNPGVSKMTIYCELPGSRGNVTKARVLDNLEEMGLVEVRVSGRRREYRLTAYGGIVVPKILDCIDSCNQDYERMTGRT